MTLLMNEYVGYTVVIKYVLLNEAVLCIDVCMIKNFRMGVLSQYTVFCNKYRRHNEVGVLKQSEVATGLACQCEYCGNIAECVEERGRCEEVT
jgi:hypothetical protein